MRARDIPVRDRLVAKIAVQPNGCWHFTGVIDSNGYGRIGYRGRRSVPVQQVAYTEFVGPIPDGLVVDHLCHSLHPTCPGGTSCLHRRCANPAHLRLLTNAENSRLGKERVTHCPQGHPYDEGNTRVTNGRRFCKACNRAAKQRLRARQKAGAAA